MNEKIKAALNEDRLIDITTIGRKTGQSRRIEIGFHIINNRIYISGLPGKRGWYANLLANPAFVFHLKQSVQADIPAEAIPITDTDRRKEVLTRIVAKWKRSHQVEAFLKGSPLVEVQFSDSL